MAYTPTVYTNDASSPDLDATNLNKSEQGIKDAHLMSVPIDCTSRVAEYTGDGIPLIPDNVEGTTYRSNFATTDSWTTTTGAVKAVGGKLKFTASSAYCDIYRSATPGLANGQSLVVKVTSLIDSNISIRAGTYQNIMKTIAVEAGVPILVSISTTGITSTTSLWFFFDAKVTVEIEFIYIGTGAYDYQNKDRSGNGNNLTLKAVTPVNGKYGKEMSFNGSTSYAQASSPVIGTTGTVAVRFKRGTLGTEQWLLSNTSAASNGLGLYFNASNVLRLIFSNGTSFEGYGTKVFNSTSAYSTVVINSSGQVFYDGVLSTDIVPTTWVLGLRNLVLGSNLADYFNGIISHFRYDSRIWTADEARAWSLNPISIDSRM